jgi:hypothetical protein
MTSRPTDLDDWFRRATLSKLALPALVTVLCLQMPRLFSQPAWYLRDTVGVGSSRWRHRFATFLLIPAPLCGAPVRGTVVAGGGCWVVRWSSCPPIRPRPVFEPGLRRTFPHLLSSSSAMRADGPAAPYRCRIASSSAWLTRCRRWQDPRSELTPAIGAASSSCWPGLRQAHCRRADRCARRHRRFLSHALP